MLVIVEPTCFIISQVIFLISRVYIFLGNHIFYYISWPSPFYNFDKTSLFNSDVK